MNDVDFEAKKMMVTTTAAEAAARSRIDSSEVRNEIADGFNEQSIYMIDSIRYFVCFLCKLKQRYE